MSFTISGNNTCLSNSLKGNQCVDQSRLDLKY